MKPHFLFIVAILAFSEAYSQFQLMDSTMAKAVSERGYVDTRIPFRKFSGSGPKGYTFTSDSLATKVTFINFWFEACAPCVAEFDALNALYEKYKNETNFQFISVTYEEEKDISKLIKKYKLKFPIVHVDRDKIHDLIFQLGFPTNIITDGSGIIRFIKTGGRIEPDQAQEDFDKIYSMQVERLLFRH